MFYLFWLSIGFIGYTFMGYPVAIWVVGRLSGKQLELDKLPFSENASWPDITVVIPAYNEAEHISAKITSLRSSNYPQEKMRILSRQMIHRIRTGYASFPVGNSRIAKR